VAEKLFYNETTTGTKQDIEQASDMARKMVCEWGMAEGLGPVSYGQEEEPIFLGKEIARHKDYSEDTAQRIDRAIKQILDAGRVTAGAILAEHREQLEKLAEALMIRETLIDDEVRTLIGLPPRPNLANLLEVPADPDGAAESLADASSNGQGDRGQ
jgi:cell division protease FtsH